MSQAKPLEPISKAPVLGDKREEWLENMKFSCVRCNDVFTTRKDVMRHYDQTRHDKYSAFK